MTAILEMPEVRARVSPLSVAEYHQLGEFNENGKRTELIRGIVIKKMAKSPLRCSIASVLFKMILHALPDGFTARQESPLTLADSEPEPDVSVMRGADSAFRHAHPSTAELVVEIAVSSVTLDRENASLYAEAGVREYWIVLARERRVEVHRQPRNGTYSEKVIVSAPDTLVCGSMPEIAIPLGELFA